MRRFLVVASLLTAVSGTLAMLENQGMSADMSLFETRHFYIGARPEDREKYKITLADLQECAAWLDQSYKVIVTDMKFREPWGHRIEGKLLVQLEYLGDWSVRNRTYAIAEPSGIIRINLPFFHTTTSVSGQQSIRVIPGTIAHEVFHLVQRAYDRQEARWFQEGTANWSAAQVFPNNHDIVDGEGLFLDSAQLSLHHPRKLPDDNTDYWRRGRGYGTSLFFRYLTKHEDEGLIHRIWEYCASHEGPNAMEAVVRVLGGESPGTPVFHGQGARIMEVDPNSPAAEAGLQAGDMIVTYGSNPVDGPEGLLRLIRSGVEDQWVDLTLRRGDRVILALARLKERESPTRGTVGYLGVKVDRSASDPAAVRDVDISSLPPVSVFGDSVHGRSQNFRTLYDRFAVGCVLMDEAPPECMLPDVDLFEKKRPDASKGLSGRFDRGRIIDLTGVWTNFYQNDFRGPRSCALQLDFASQAAPNYRADGEIAGVGTRCFQLPKVTGLAPETPLRVLVRDQEDELSVQGLIRRSPSGPWEVISAERDIASGHQCLHVSNLDLAVQETYILIARYADDYARKVYPMQVSVATPPVLADLTIERESKVMLHEMWYEVQDSAGRPTRRKRQTVTSTPMPRSGTAAKIQLTFSVPVQEIPSQPICTVDGAIDVDLVSRDNGKTWSGVLPLALLAPGDSHQVLVNAQARPTGTKAAMPLDEDPGTLAVQLPSGWRGYEYEGQGLVVTFPTAPGKPAQADKIVGKWWAIGGRLATRNYRGGTYVYDRKKQREYLGFDLGPLSHVVITKSGDGYRGTTSGGDTWILKFNGVNDDGKLCYNRTNPAQPALRSGLTMYADGSRFWGGETMWLPDSKVKIVE